MKFILSPQAIMCLLHRATLLSELPQLAMKVAGLWPRRIPTDFNGNSSVPAWTPKMQRWTQSSDGWSRIQYQCLATPICKTVSHSQAQL